MRLFVYAFVKDQLFPYLMRLRVAPLHLYKTVPFSIHSLIGPGYTRPTRPRYTWSSCLANAPIALLCKEATLQHPPFGRDVAGHWFSWDGVGRSCVLVGSGWHWPTPTLLLNIFYIFIM